MIPGSTGCTVCYGSGTGSNGKPCPYGCRPIPTVAAAPALQGEPSELSDAEIWNWAATFSETTDSGWHFKDGEALRKFARCILSRRNVTDAAPRTAEQLLLECAVLLKERPKFRDVFIELWRGDAAPDQDKRDAWFAANPNTELSSDYGPDGDEDLQWVVTRVVGSPNDRAWREVGRGRTPSAAIVAAMQSGEKQ